MNGPSTPSPFATTATTAAGRRNESIARAVLALMTLLLILPLV